MPPSITKIVTAGIKNPSRSKASKKEWYTRQLFQKSSKKQDTYIGITENEFKPDSTSIHRALDLITKKKNQLQLWKLNE